MLMAMPLQIADLDICCLGPPEIRVLIIAQKLESISVISNAMPGDEKRLINRNVDAAATGTLYQ